MAKSYYEHLNELVKAGVSYKDAQQEASRLVKAEMDAMSKSDKTGNNKKDKDTNDKKDNNAKNVEEPISNFQKVNTDINPNVAKVYNIFDKNDREAEFRSEFEKIDKDINSVKILCNRFFGLGKYEVRIYGTIRQNRLAKIIIDGETEIDNLVIR